MFRWLKKTPTATAAAVPEKSDKDCILCSELFTAPKLLPCGHELCRHCLLQWLKTQPHAQCPLCRFPIVDPGRVTDRQSWDVVADALPTDLAMQEQVEAEHLLITNHPCSFCHKAQATSLCLDCRDKLCHACKPLHTRSTMLRHHTVRDLATLNVAHLTSPPKPCPAHPDKGCELYCPSHDLAMCHVCAETEHSSCANVTDLEQNAEESRKKLTGLAAKLRAAERELDAAMEQLDQHLQQTKASTEAGLAELKAVCDRLKATIDATYERAKRQKEGTCSDVTTLVQDGKSRLTQRRRRATAHDLVIERVQEMKNCDGIRTMTSLMETRISNLDLSSTLPHEVMAKVNVGINTVALKQLELEVSICLGQVKISQAEPPRPQIQTQVQKKEVVETLMFHTNHGNQIVLSDDQRTAKRTGRFNKGGIVLGNRPMKIDTVYEVLVDKKDSATGHYMYAGVTGAAPSTLALPDTNTCYSWTSVVVICDDIVRLWGKTTISSNIGKGLVGLPANSTIGLLVDKNRYLHLYINGKDQGVAAPDMPDPSYPLFELWGPYRQVTALPLRAIPSSSEVEPSARDSKPSTSEDKPIASEGKPFDSAGEPTSNAAEPTASSEADPSASAGEPSATASEPSVKEDETAL